MGGNNKNISKKTQIRGKTQAVNVGGIVLGGNAPIVVQSMTNTDTADVASTVQQIVELENAGSELVRVTIDRDKAAAAIPKIHELLIK